MNETLADIVTEMRRGDTYGSNRIYTIPRHNPHTGYYDIEGVTLDDLADRIEAAAQRLVREERTEAIDEALAHAEEVRQAKCRNCERAPGSAAAMRVALEIFVHDFASFRTDVEHGILHMMQCMDFVKEYIPLMEAALAAPVRNCDVGTAEEQCLRFWRETEREPEIARSVGGFSRWAQLPYEEEETRKKEGGAK